MKKNILIIASLMMIFSNGMSQGVEKFTKDSADLKPGFTHDVFYSIADGSKTTVKRDQWDLAFSNNSFDEYLFANHGAGVKIYIYPNGDTSKWSTFDTSGFDTWKPVYGSDTNINFGAFCQNYTGNSGNYSWGEYRQDLGHIILGNRIYLIDIKGTMKKLWIIKKARGTYTIRYADLNHANEHTVAIKNSGKNYFFSYYSITNNKTVMHEPMGKKWDIWFTKYTTQIPVGGGNYSPYAVVGGLISPKHCVAVHKTGDRSTLLDLKDLECSKKSNTIGYNWKKYDFQGKKYIIKDSNYYIFLDAISMDKIINFTGYNSRAGKIYFDQYQFKTVALNKIGSKITSSYIYPNPSNGQSINVYIPGNFNKVKFNITNTMGENLMEGISKSNKELYSINTSNISLKNGIYFITFSGAFGEISHILHIEK